MAPARETGLPGEHPSGREQETHCVSPARAGQCSVDRQVREQQRPAPDPAGEKRPPGAGRALAGGFGPPAGVRSAWHCGRGDGPCQSCRASRHAQGHRLSGRDEETLRLSQPARNGSPSIGRSGHNRRPAPAGGGSGAGRGLWPPAGPVARGMRTVGAMAPARTVGARAEQFPAFRSGRPQRSALFSTLSLRSGTCSGAASLITAAALAFASARDRTLRIHEDGGVFCSARSGSPGRG